MDLLAEGLWEELLDDEQPDITVMDWYVPLSPRSLTGAPRSVSLAPPCFGLSSPPGPSCPCRIQRCPPPLLPDTFGLGNVAAPGCRFLHRCLSFSGQTPPSPPYPSAVGVTWHPQEASPGRTPPCPGHSRLSQPGDRSGPPPPLNCEPHEGRARGCLGHCCVASTTQPGHTEWASVSVLNRGWAQSLGLGCRGCRGS